MILVGMLVLSFALFVTAHVTITWGLAFKTPRWRAPVAFFFAPLGAVWAWRERMRVRFWVLVAALALYLIALAIAQM